MFIYLYIHILIYLYIHIYFYIKYGDYLFNITVWQYIHVLASRDIPMVLIIT